MELMAESLWRNPAS